MRAAVSAAVCATALSVLLGAVVLAAAPPLPGTIGLRLAPAPIYVDETRTLTATNLSGGLAVAVTLTPSDGYSVEPSTFTLAPEGSQLVTLTAVDPSQDGSLHAVAASTGRTKPGTAQSAIALSVRLLHASSGTWAVLQAVLLAAFAFLLAAFAAFAFYRWHRAAFPR